ncbi:MAG: fused MFS/spermidine synthase [Alphaproteobacteria bacterium]|nr:fused MFS/spermidine synthase [Alphaproteobacteria bacterium]
MSTERRELAFFALLPLFFLSGATALAYQTLWVRELELVFGTSTFAISTVLAAFMGGLAVGGFVMGRYADRIAHPLRTYGLLEIGIGLYAVVFPHVVDLVSPLYLSLWRSMEPGPMVFGLAQFVLVGTTLVLPTALMGGTLPLLARFATERLGSAGDRVGTLYSVNTFGAVAGTLLCGFVLLPSLGCSTTTWMAAAANLLLGSAAVGLDVWMRNERLSVVADVAPPPFQGTGALRIVSIAVGLAGFSALVYEVAWTRLLALMLGASVYSFTLMLLAFLVGIAVGGKIGGPIADRLWARGGLEAVMIAFAAVEVGIALLSFLMMYLYPELPYWYVWIFDAFDAAEHPRAVWTVSLVVSALVMTPPAVLMGIHFPMAVRAVIGREDELGGPVGVVYGANTLGGVAGAFLAGFVMLPTIRVQGTISVAALAELLAAMLLIGAGTAPGRRMLVAIPGAVMVGLAVLGVAARPPWDPMLMTAGMYHYVTSFEDHTRRGIKEFSIDLYELVYYAEGLSSVVTVARNKENGNLWLANNGKVDASTTVDMPTQVLCSLLPMQFVEKPDDVLVIGLASGVTAGAVSQVTTIGNLEVVELEPVIEQAAKYFSAYNHDIVHNPKVRLIRNDGRNHVLLAPEHSYDVIVSEPPNPWISGVANLFTKDFLEIGKTRLKPGGVWSQWVQLYGMDTEDLRTLLRTFAEVYPYVLVYATIEEADLVLVGSESPIAPTPDAADRLFRFPGVREDLAEIPITGPMGIVALYQFDRDQILEMTKGAGLNTDDNMAIEYSAPLNLHADTSDDNVLLLIENAKIPLDSMPKDADLIAGLARTYQERDDVVRSVATMAIAAKMVPEDDPRRQRWLDQAREWQDELEEDVEEEEVEGDQEL